MPTTSVSREGQRDVIAPEGERVTHRVPVVARSWLTAHYVQVHFWIEIPQVQRRGDDAVPQGQHGQYRLHRPDGAERVAERRLGGVDLRRVRSQRSADCVRFRAVTGNGAGGVGVDVVDVARGETGKLDRPRHRAAGLLTAGIGEHRLVAVEGYAGAHKSANDVGAA